jgi:hypothetical protein
MNNELTGIEITEQEVIATINMIGNNGTWELIEMVADYKLRLKYREMFFRVGGKIPERENDNII